MIQDCVNLASFMLTVKVPCAHFRPMSFGSLKRQTADCGLQTADYRPRTTDWTNIIKIKYKFHYPQPPPIIKKS